MADISILDPAVDSDTHDDHRRKRRARQYQRWVAATTRPLDVLALIFLVDFLAGRLVDNGNWGWQPVLDAISLLIWLAFAVDYVVRLTLSPERWTFVRTHKLDLVMVLLPMLRVLRAVLLLRKSFQTISMERIAGSLFTIVAVVVATGAVLEWRVEYNAPNATITTLGTAFWWAVVTTTTVGYGDTYPVTSAGRLIASVIMVVGIGLIGTVSATVAAWFVARKQRLHDDQLKAEKVARRRRFLARTAAASAPDGQITTHPDAPTPTGGVGDGTGLSAPDSTEHADVVLADSASEADRPDGDLLDEERSLSDAVAALTAQIRALTTEQQALRASVAALANQRSG